MLIYAYSHFEIKNKVAESGLINFDLSSLVPKGERIGIDLKDYLYEGLILKEKDFREKVAAVNSQDYNGAYVYIYNSAEAIVPLWAYFLLTAKLTGSAKKVVFGNREDLEVLLMHHSYSCYKTLEAIP